MDRISLKKKPEFTQDWFSQNIPTLTKLLSCYKKIPTTMLEIGCFEGRSTLWFLENVLKHENSWISCVDTFRGSPEHQSMGIDVSGLYRKFLRNVPVRAIRGARYGWEPEYFCAKSKVELWVANSRDTLRAQRQYNVYDVVYIDGSHFQENVLEDAVLSWPLLKTGGLLIFDDFGFKDPVNNLFPANGIVGFANVYRHHLEVLAVDWLFAARKIEGVRS